MKFMELQLGARAHRWPPRIVDGRPRPARLQLHPAVPVRSPLRGARCARPDSGVGFRARCRELRTVPPIDGVSERHRGPSVELERSTVEPNAAEPGATNATLESFPQPPAPCQPGRGAWASTCVRRAELLSPLSSGAHERAAWSHRSTEAPEAQLSAQPPPVNRLSASAADASGACCPAASECCCGGACCGGSAT